MSRSREPVKICKVVMPILSTLISDDTISCQPFLSQHVTFVFVIAGIVSASIVVNGSIFCLSSNFYTNRINWYKLVFYSKSTNEAGITEMEVSIHVSYNRSKLILEFCDNNEIFFLVSDK